MADTNKRQNVDESSKPSEAGSKPSYCPFCGFENQFHATYCPNCGKKIKEEEPTNNGRSVGSNSSSSPKSNRSRIITIAALIGIIAVGLVVGIMVFNSPQTDNSNLGSTVQPTISSTLTPTLTPTATPTQSIEITGINVEINYAASDQGYFGPESQSVAISNQPNDILTVNQGQQFFVYFTLTATTSSTSSDSIASVTSQTSGFTVVSVQPQVPITFSPGAAIQITVTLQAPQSAFNGPIQLALSTSG